jgi:hypothetical protein
MVQECGRLKYSEFPTKTKITLKSRRPNLLDSLILSICLMMMKMEGNGFHPIMNIMEVVLTLPIKAKRTTFNWMYIDYNTLQNAALPMAYKLN